MTTIQDLQDEREFKYGSMVAYIKIRIGFPTFTPGASQADNWHDITDIGDKPGRKKVRAAVELINVKNGKVKGGQGRESASPTMSLAIIAMKGKVYINGELKAWENDMYYTYANWMKGYNEVVAPSIVAAGLEAGFEGWVRLGEQVDPAGGTRTGTNGKEYAKTVRHIIEVFVTEDDAMTAVAKDKAEAGDGKNNGAKSTLPYTDDDWLAIAANGTGYSRNQWELQAPKVKARLAAGEKVKVIAAELDIEAKYIAMLVDDQVPA